MTVSMTSDWRLAFYSRVMDHIVGESLQHKFGKQEFEAEPV